MEGSLDSLFEVTNVLEFFVNGQKVSIKNPDPIVLLIEWLRYNGLTGTKFSCGQGGCGACTVIICPTSTYPIYRAVNACLRPLVAMQGMELITIEGLGSTQAKIDTVQETIAKYNGSQCGYCTPGFVCAMKSYLLNTESKPESRNILDIEDIFDGHLCRCTGYRPILCGMKTFSICGNKKELENTPPISLDPSFSYSTHSMKHKNVVVVEEEEEEEETDYPTTSPKKKRARISSGPPILQVFSDPEGVTWIKVNTMNQLVLAIKQNEARKDKIHLTVGNTAYGIQIFQEAIKKQTVYIHIADVPDLLGITRTESSLVVGGAEMLQALYQYLAREVKAHASDDPCSTFPPEIMYRHMMRLATTEIRNAGSVGGNMYLAKMWGFPSDLICLLMTLDASVKIHVAGKIQPIVRSIADFMADDSLQLDGTNIIQSVDMPIISQPNTFIRTYKISNRPQNSHPIVNAGFVAHLDVSSFSDVRVVFGGIAKKTQRMPETEKYMMESCSPRSLGTQLKELLSCLYSELASVIVPSQGFENVSEHEVKMDKQHRLTTARNLFLKYLIELALVFELPGWKNVDKLQSGIESLVTSRMESTSSGCQDFCVYKDTAPVSEPLVKQSAFLQACGEAKYSQDLAMSSHDLLHGVYIFNTKYAHAKFDKIAPSKEFYSKFPQVVKVFTAEDVDAEPDKVDGADVGVVWKPTMLLPIFHRHSVVAHEPKNRNDLGLGMPGLPGDTVFAGGEVIYIGQPVGMVVAKNESVAREAAQWIQENGIVWHLLPEPPILELDDAIEKKNFFPGSYRLKKVSRPVTLNSVDWDQIQTEHPDWVTLEGSQLAGSQYHFYMENQTAVGIPQEGGKIKVIASSQSPSMIQSKAAQVCRLPMNYVIVETTRLGGGYGGKEPQSQFVAAAASFCAHSLNRPVSVSLLRTEDMNMIGKRHEVLGKFKVAASKDGKIQAMEVDFYSNGGCTYDASFPVMDLILLSADNAYYIPQFLAKGEVCMTFKATSTAFRSFGVVQTMLIVESAMEAISEKLGLPGEDVRQANFYETSMTTPYGQCLQYCNLQGVWDHIYETSNYTTRKQEVQKFNEENSLKKRGIKLIPLKYGISFTHKSMNQSGALINVYSNDGTILLSIGGIEMGQGLNTKMMQIAAYTLNVPFDFIDVGRTSTEKVPNAPSTGASTGSDLNGGAVKDACEVLKRRLEKFMDDLVETADLATYKGDKKEVITQWKNGNKSWNSKTAWPTVVSLAFNERVSLSAQGFFKSPDLDQLSNENPEGRAFYYFNYAAAVSEVEVDVLTGETTVLRSDVVYDAGHSLNPAIDVGQIEGGFVMGIGNVVTEKLIYDKDGRLITNGTWEYKPPDTKSIPKDFRVTIYPGAEHKSLKRPAERMDHTATDDNPVLIDPHGIQSSKATGEPPLVLANSVFFAIRDAVKEARRESGLSTEGFKFNSPATVVDVELACGFDPNKAL